MLLEKFAAWERAFGPCCWCLTEIFNFWLNVFLFRISPKTEPVERPCWLGGRSGAGGESRKGNRWAGKIFLRKLLLFSERVAIFFFVRRAEKASRQREGKDEKTLGPSRGSDASHMHDLWASLSGNGFPLPSNGAKQVTKTVVLPASFTVDVKDMSLVVIETEKWSDQFVKDIIKAFLKLKLEQQRYGDKTDREKSEAVEAKRQEFERGEFEVRVGSAATLTLVEEQFRQLLSEEFKAARQKKSECDKMARSAERETLFRDLCIKPLYHKLGKEYTQEELQAKADEYLYLYQQKAENNAERIRQMKAENQIRVTL